MKKDLHKLKDVLEQSPWLYAYLADEYKSKAELARIVFAQDGSLLEHAPEEVQGNKELVILAVNNGDALEYASEELQTDKDVIISALEYDDSILDDLDEEFLEDLDIMRKAVWVYPENYTYFSEELQEDKEVALTCLEENVAVYEFFSDDLKDDDQITDTALQLGLDLACVESMVFRGDKKIVKNAITHNGGNQLRYASKELQDNKSLATYAIEKGLAYVYALGETLRADRVLVKGIVANMPVEHELTTEMIRNVRWIAEELIADDEFMLELIKENEYLFAAMYKERDEMFVRRSIPVCEDANFCRKAYAVNSKTLKYMGNAMKAAVKGNK